jgi:hypothetical protein
VFMADRKATFAKRQRETELKDRAREKEARRQQRRTTPRVSKGPEIAWDEAVRFIESPLTGDLAPSVDPGEDAPIPIPDGPTRPDAPRPDAPRPVMAAAPTNGSPAPSNPNPNPNPGAPVAAKPSTPQRR